MKNFKQFLVEVSEKDKETSEAVKSDEQSKEKQDAAKKAAVDKVNAYLDNLNTQISTAYKNDPRKQSDFWNIPQGAMGDLSTIRNQVKDYGVSPVLDAEAKKAKDIPIVGNAISDVVGSEILKRAMTEIGLMQDPVLGGKISAENQNFLTRLKELEANPNLTPSQIAIALRNARNKNIDPAWTVSPPPPANSTTSTTK